MDTSKAPTAGTTASTAGQPQVWHVDAEAGVRYRVLIDSDSSSSEQVLWAGAWPSAGSDASEWGSAPTGIPQVLSLRPDQDGSMEVRLPLSAATREDTATYRLQVVEWPADDHADSGLRSTPLTAGMAATGTLEDGLDRDGFALDLEAGRTVRFSARTDSDAAATSLPLSTMSSSGGIRVASNDAIEFTAPWAGRWVLQVGGGRCNPGSYNVASEWVEAPPTLSAPSAGEMQFSRLPVAGQHERWALTLAADERVAVQHLDGAQSRDWQIDVETFAGPIDYQLAVSRVRADDHADEPSKATALAMGSSVPGRFESVGEWDWFSLMLSDQESVDVVVSGSARAQWAVN